MRRWSDASTACRIEPGRAPANGSGRLASMSVVAIAACTDSTSASALATASVAGKGAVRSAIVAGSETASCGPGSEWRGSGGRSGPYQGRAGTGTAIPGNVFDQRRVERGVTAIPVPVAGVRSCAAPSLTATAGVAGDEGSSADSASSTRPLAAARLIRNRIRPSARRSPLRARVLTSAARSQRVTGWHVC